MVWYCKARQGKESQSYSLRLRAGEVHIYCVVLSGEAGSGRVLLGKARNYIHIYCVVLSGEVGAGRAWLGKVRIQIYIHSSAG